MHEMTCFEMNRMLQRGINESKATIDIANEIIENQREQLIADAELLQQYTKELAEYRRRFSDLHTDIFHPEFGTAWDDDGECTKAYEQGYIAAMQQKEVVKKRLPKIEVHEIYKREVKCSDHPFAPHGFDRESSILAGRYVCDCENYQ